MYLHVFVFVICGRVLPAEYKGGIVITHILLYWNVAK